jgi:hypothetical protein
MTAVEKRQTRKCNAQNNAKATQESGRVPVLLVVWVVLI